MNDINSMKTAIEAVLKATLTSGCRVEQYEDGRKNGKCLTVNGVVMVRHCDDDTFAVWVVGQNGTLLDPVDAIAAVVSEIAKISAIEMAMMELGLGED